MRAGESARGRARNASVAPRWTENDVRRLLKAVRRPHSLREIPLALAIARDYESDDPLDAVRRFVNETFKGGGIVGRRLLDLIERCDFDAALPMTAVAAQLGLSPRQLFRHRREAVRALQRRAESLGGAHAKPKDVIARIASVVGQTDPRAAQLMYGIAGASDVDLIARVDAAVNSGAITDSDLPHKPDMRLLALCRVARGAAIFGDFETASQIVRYVRAELSAHPLLSTGPAIRFELAWLAFLDQRGRGDVKVAQSLALALLDLAGGDPSLSLRAQIFVAESCIRCGDTAAAERALTSAEQLTSPSDAAATALILTCKGAIAMIHHDFGVVDECYSAAELILGRRSMDLWSTQTFIGRARLMLGMEWRPAGGAVAIERLEWTSLRIGDAVFVLPPDSRAAPARIQVALVGVRASIRAVSADLAAAELQTLALLELSNARRFGGVAAYALAVLAEIHARRGEWELARRRIVDAWKAWSLVEDRIAAVDMFAFGEIDTAFAVRDNDELCRAVASWSNRLDAGQVRRLLDTDYAATSGVPDLHDPLVAGIIMLFPSHRRESAAAAIADIMM